MDNNLIITIPQAVPIQTIDNWNSSIEKAPSQEGKYYGKETIQETNDSIRSCDVRNITIQQRKLYQDIFNNIFSYVDYYESSFNVDFYRKLEINHVTYNIGGHYINHTDTHYNINMPTQRKISMVLMLSDKSEYEGGELVFAKQSFKEQKGTLIMFRPTAVHAVQKVTSGIRKSLVLWVHGPEWR